MPRLAENPGKQEYMLLGLSSGHQSLKTDLDFTDAPCTRWPVELTKRKFSRTTVSRLRGPELGVMAFPRLLAPPGPPRPRSLTPPGPCPHPGLTMR